MSKIWWAKKATIGNIDPCLAHKSKRHLMSFLSRYFLNRSTLHLANFLEGSLVFKIISNMLRLKFSSLALFATKVVKECKNKWVIKSIGKMVLLLYSSTILTPNSLPTTIETIIRLSS